MVPKLHIVMFFVSLMAGCGTISNGSKVYARISKAAGFENAILKTKDFAIAASYSFKKPGETLTIYIEGDGNAWISRTQLSSDPTPRKPLVIELATEDASANVAYLARPGQYPATEQADCSPAYWASKRFSREVIDSMNEAVSELVHRADANKIDLIGYSGGAAIAVLIASQRDDVRSLRTIAGNLDPDELNLFHHVSPLAGLDPMGSATLVEDIPQLHFVGTRDKIVPTFIARSFVRQMGDKDDERIVVVKGVSHTKGWDKHWKELLSYPLKNSASR